MTISPTKSTFSASPKSGNQLLDDGNGGSTLTFTAKDANGDPVTGLTDIGFASSLTGSSVSPNPAVETPAGSGIYIAKLTSTAAGDANVSVTDKGTAIAGIAAQKVTFKAAGSTTPTPGPIAGASSAFTVTPASGAALIADNTSTSALSFTAKDANGVAVPGLTDITFTADITEATVSAIAETPANSGIYTATVKSSKAGAVVITVKQGGTAITGVATKTVTFAATPPGPLSGSKTKMTINPATFAHGTGTSHKAVITVTAKDAAGKAIPGLTDLTLVLSGTDSAKAAVTALTESSTTAGSYESTMTATDAATAVVVTLQKAGADVSGVATLSVDIT